MTDRSSRLPRPVLTTARLSLRRPEARDVPAIVAIVGGREVALRLSRIPHPYDAADAAFFLDHVVPAEWVWAITLHGDDRLIGAVGLVPDGDVAELGYWLAPSAWGQGIVTVAAAAVVAYGFETLGLPYLLSGYFAKNPASGRALTKLGFRETGRATRPCMAAGHDVPSVEMRLDRLTPA